MGFVPFKMEFLSSSLKNRFFFWSWLFHWGFCEAEMSFHLWKLARDSEFVFRVGGHWPFHFWFSKFVSSFLENNCSFLCRKCPWKEKTVHPRHIKGTLPRTKRHFASCEDHKVFTKIDCFCFVCWNGKPCKALIEDREGRTELWMRQRRMVVKMCQSEWPFDRPNDLIKPIRTNVNYLKRRYFFFQSDNYPRSTCPKSDMMWTLYKYKETE